MPDWTIVAVIAVIVLFGGTQVSKIARSLGSAKSEFEKGKRDGETDTSETDSSKEK